MKHSLTASKCSTEDLIYETTILELDKDLVKKIGITKPTLYARISRHNWKVSEIFLIEKMK